MILLNAAALDRAIRRHPQSRAWLENWQRVVTADKTRWMSIVDLRRTYPHADGVPLGRGRRRIIVTVFNVGGSDFRLLTITNFRRQIVQVEEVLTHAEYSSNRWKRRYQEEQSVTTTIRPRRKDDYLDLVARHPLRKLGTQAGHTQALAVSASLLGLTRKLSAGESQYVDALLVLIREFEQSRRASGPPATNSVNVLRHLLARHGMTQRQFAALIGVGDSAASMILSGQRELTKSHIVRLAAHFGVGASAFF